MWVLFFCLFAQHFHGCAYGVRSIFACSVCIASNSGVRYRITNLIVPNFDLFRCLPIMKCDGCLKPTKGSNAIRCSSAACEKTFCSLCINTASISAEKKKYWKCPDCCAVKKGGDNSHTPVRSSSDSQNVTMRKPEPPREQVETDLSDLTIELRQLTKEITSLRTELGEVTQSLSHCHNRLDEIVLSMKSTDARLKALERRDKEVIDLKGTVARLEGELTAQAQNILRNEIEIVGVPENQSENLYHTVQVVATKLGVELTDSDVDWVTRVGPRRMSVSASLPDEGAKLSRPVVLRLLRRSKRDELIKASKARRNLTSTDLVASGTTGKVFLNERLTKENRILFRDTRSRSKQAGYAFCWCNQASIYVRQREGKSAVLIRSRNDLDRIIPPGSYTVPE